jgi:hypothetical protein
MKEKKLYAISTIRLLLAIASLYWLLIGFGLGVAAAPHISL